MNYLDLDRQLNEMIIQGKSVEAFDRFYAEDVVAQENDEPERVGLEQWKQARAGMEKMTKKFDAKVLAHAANGDVTFSEWEYNLDLEGMGPIAMKRDRSTTPGCEIRKRSCTVAALDGARRQASVALNAAGVICSTARPN